MIEEWSGVEDDHVSGVTAGMIGSEDRHTIPTARDAAGVATTIASESSTGIIIVTLSFRVIIDALLYPNRPARALQRGTRALGLILLEKEKKRHCQLSKSASLVLANPFLVIIDSI